MPGIPVRFIVAAAVLEALMLGLRSFAAHPSGTVEAILVQFPTYSVYLLAVYWALQPAASSRAFLLFTLAGALLFRITVWPLPAPFTDDVHRYRWEGKLQAAGGNPYTARPNDPKWTHLRDSAFDRVGQKDFPGGYGPAWNAIEHLTYAAVSRIQPDPARQVLWFKLPAAIFDLLTIAALMSLLRAHGKPLSHVIVYAWSPLPVWEFWANGHNDASVIFFIVASMVLAFRSRWLGSIALLAFAAALKFWPLVLLPAYLLRSRRWLAGPAIVTAILGVFALPYAADITENIRFMTGFMGGWRNNDSLFTFIAWAAGEQYRAKYIAMALIAFSTLWFAFRPWPLERTAMWTVVALLLLSSNCHPWYLTWFLPLLAVRPVTPLLLWAGLMPLAYAVLIPWQTLGIWDGSTTLRWWIYVPVFAAFFFMRDYNEQGRPSERQVSI